MIYANNIEGTITRFNTLPDDWKGLEGFKYSDKETREAHGFFELVIPTIDSETQYLGEIIGNEPLTQYTYKVIDKTLEELQKEKQEEIEQSSQPSKVDTANEQFITELQKQTDPQKQLDNQDMYPFWTGEDYNYKAGVKVQAFDVLEVILYECIKDHISQEDWNPPNVPELFKEVII